MKRLLLRLLPERAAAQMAWIVTVSLGLVLLATALALSLLLPSELARQPSFPYASEAISFARHYQAARSASVGAAVLETKLASNARFRRLDPAAIETLQRTRYIDRLFIDGIQRELGSIARVFALRPGRPGPPAIGLQFDDGLTLSVSPPPGTMPPGGFAFILAIVAMLGFVVILVGLLSLWATRAVVSPLTRLAEAVDRFDPDRDDVVEVERGSVEVRRLARAFGGMAARIRRLVDERTRMLAAVSHDLRTPITRLRLRAEDIAEEDKRQAILADLALMERMVGGALSYLREGRASGSMVATDIPALLQTICDDFGDLGHIVVYQGPMRASALCDSDQMMRAVTNLVDNAIKFGGKATVRLDDADPDRIAVIVEDDGPGIAPEERERVFEPFYRSDLARTLREGSGFGLGLAIVRAIAEGHRGELTLSERPGGGLRAAIAWPRRW